MPMLSLFTVFKVTWHAVGPVACTLQITLQITLQSGNRSRSVTVLLDTDQRERKRKIRRVGSSE